MIEDDSIYFLQDIIHFHKTIKDVCDKHNPEYYPKFKKTCDDFFYNSVRGKYYKLTNVVNISEFVPTQDS